MSLEQTACEDLKAFERRLTEVIACLHPSTIRWRIVLIVVSICIATGAGQWLMDPETRIVPLSQSLTNHPFFIVSTIMFCSNYFISRCTQKSDSSFHYYFKNKG
ncbi:nuclear envelope phosphatase-regulatory subunit 1-like, partial [Asbolus verrucosus]